MYHGGMSGLPVTGVGFGITIGGSSVAAMSGQFWLTLICAMAFVTLALWARFGRRGLVVGLVASIGSLVIVGMMVSGLVGLILLALAVFTLVGAAFAFERALPVPLLGFARREPEQLAPTERPVAPFDPRYG